MKRIICCSSLWLTTFPFSFLLDHSVLPELHSLKKERKFLLMLFFSQYKSGLIISEYGGDLAAVCAITAHRLLLEASRIIKKNKD